MFGGITGRPGEVAKSRENPAKTGTVGKYVCAILLSGRWLLRPREMCCSSSAVKVIRKRMQEIPLKNYTYIHITIYIPEFH